MQRSSDVVVIGGGIAGTAAALASARGGAGVTLVRAAPGATALCLGGWRGNLPEKLEQAFSAVEHPWPETAQPLPAPDGTLRPFERAATAQASARCSRRTLVCGVAGLAGFRADVLARLWSDQLEVEMHGVELTLDDTPAAGWAPAALATRLERDCTDVGHALRTEAQRFGASSIIAPAVLGFENNAAVLAALAQATDLPVGEALAAAPTIPGWRLQSALDRMLARASVAVVTAHVVDRRTDHDSVQAVVLRTREGEVRELRAAAFVLATGKFIGGGIDAHDEFREPALNLPVWIDHLGERFDRNEPLTLTNAERTEDQPLLGVGVETSADLQPLSPGGTVLYRNVWAAGAVRAEPELGRLGLGAAAAEGWAAGERAVG